MKLIEQLNGELPNWRWKEHSLQEMASTNPMELLDESDFVWRIGDAALVGFVYTSLVNPPWLWFLLAENVGIKDLIDFRRLTSRIPIGTMTAVLDTFTVGRKFAEFYGFQYTGESVDKNDRRYNLMRKV